MTSALPKAVVIGASAGALEALSVILPALPPGYPLPVFVVVHIPPDKQSLMGEVLRPKCALAVREAEDKEPALAGTVYLAAPDYHLLVEKDLRLSFSNEEPVNFSRPSIDVLFETAADAYGAGLTGVVLTGGNQDGSQGLKAVVAAGGRAVVLDPAKAYAPDMPRHALAACPGALSLSLEQIADYLRKEALS